jgi:hypothetical protein
MLVQSGVIMNLGRLRGPVAGLAYAGFITVTPPAAEPMALRGGLLPEEQTIIDKTVFEAVPQKLSTYRSR